MLLKYTATFLLLLSIGFFVPGITLPALTMEVSVDFSIVRLPLPGSHTLMKETRSVLGAIRVLYENGYPLVASLILLFSVVVPVVKTGLALVALWLAESPVRRRLLLVAGHMSKWAMAEVFLVALFLAFLAMDAQRLTEGRPEPGFYWFLAYCLTALVGSELSEKA